MPEEEKKPEKKDKSNMTLKELLDFHEKFALGFPKCRSIQPQIIVCKNNKMDVIIVVGGRNEIKVGMELVKQSNPDWIVCLFEGYAMKVKINLSTEKGKKGIEEFKETFKHGDIEKEFKKGNKNVIEVITIQAYNKEGKLSRTVEKFSGKKLVEDISDFEGFLTIEDWGEKEYGEAM